MRSPGSATPGGYGGGAGASSEGRVARHPCGGEPGVTYPSCGRESAGRHGRGAPEGGAVGTGRSSIVWGSSVGASSTSQVAPAPAPAAASVATATTANGWTHIGASLSSGRRGCGAVAVSYPARRAAPVGPKGWSVLRPPAAPRRG